MSNNHFKVPGSSYQELIKIIKGYAKLKKGGTLGDLASLLATGKTSISPNNPFLVSVGIIGGGNIKEITDLGKELASALEYEQTSEIQSGWRKAVQNNEFLSNLISTIRIKKGMSADNLSKHILSTNRLKKHKRNLTGANTIIDILRESGLVHVDEKTSKLKVSTESTPDVSGKQEPENSQQAKETGGMVDDPKGHDITTNKESGLRPIININIQLEIPEAKDPSIYENLFKALRTQLLKPVDENNE